MSDANLFRTHLCGQPRPADVGGKITLAGFVDGSKMEGKAIDVRDGTGATSCLMPEKPSPKLEQTWGQITPESVVQVSGQVMLRKRADPAMPTGEVLLMIESLTVLSPAEVLPRELQRDAMGEEDRFRYRMLYLRRPHMQRRLEFRSKFLLEARKHLAGKGFTEVETPLLGRDGGDSASSFLLPVGDGKGYALPASPQQFKEAVIASGVERYFQIARCYRNQAETSAERQPEFSVLDVEMAFQDEAGILAATEELLAQLFESTLQIKLELPLERIPYEKAMSRYATDAPDLRARLVIADATGTAKSLGASEVTEAMGKDGTARAIRVEGGVERLGDAELDLLTARITRGGKARATWIKLGAQTGLRGPGVRFFGNSAPDAVSGLRGRQGDALLLTFAKEAGDAHRAAGELRRELVKMIGDKDARTFACAFITELPFFTYDDREKTWVARRHPLTQPRQEDLGLLDDAERNTSVLARAFTLVINGVELGSGGLRNHDLATQEKVFKLLGLTAAQVQKRYALTLETFRYGVPPHGGITLQLDRLLALVQGAEGIDEVMAFPKARVGGDLMSETPMPLDTQHVRSLLD